MKNEIRGSSAHGTGDINLAAACMALGIPLCENEAGESCKLILRGSHNYARFFLMPFSSCGKFLTLDLLAFWSHPEEIPHEEHPFKWIMDFVKARPAGVASAGEWLDFAHDYLRDRGDLPAGFPRDLEAIGGVCAANPEARFSYVLAFVHCRYLCVRIATQARRAVIMSKGPAHAIIDATLPKKTRDELLSRLDG